LPWLRVVSSSCTGCASWHRVNRVTAHCVGNPTNGGSPAHPHPGRGDRTSQAIFDHISRQSMQRRAPPIGAEHPLHDQGRIPVLRSWSHAATSGNAMREAGELSRQDDESHGGRRGSIHVQPGRPSDVVPVERWLVPTLCGGAANSGWGAHLAEGGLPR
jgi:hypothetical protein